MRAGGDFGWDPLFFLHHANVDHQWALWETANPSASTRPMQARISPPVSRHRYSCSDIGSHLWDTMWPWNGQTTSALWPATRPGWRIPQTVDALLTLPSPTASRRCPKTIVARRSIRQGLGLPTTTFLTTLIHDRPSLDFRSAAVSPVVRAAAQTPASDSLRLGHRRNPSSE